MKSNRGKEFIIGILLIMAWCQEAVNAAPEQLMYFQNPGNLIRAGRDTLVVINVFNNVYSKDNIIAFSRPIPDSYHSESAQKPCGDTAIHQSGRHLFSFSSGYARHIERDDAISPFIYRGSTIPVEIGYSYQGDKNRFAFTFFFDHLALNSVLSGYSVSKLQYSTINTNLSIANFYTRKVLSLQEHKVDLFLGGGFQLLLNYRLHSAGYSDNGNNYTMLDQFNSIAFKIQADKQYNTSGQILSFDLFMPVISYVLPGDTYNAFVGRSIDKLMNSDSNVLIETLKNGEWTSFNKLISLKANLSYTIFVGSHWGFELKYGFQYYKFTQYQNLNYSKNLQNVFLIGLKFKL